MGKRIKKLKNVRLHREGTNTLIYAAAAFVAVGLLLWLLVPNEVVFYVYAAIAAVVYLIMVNFFRCPIRYFNGETDGIVVAPADGRIVVIEEVEEDKYFHDKRIMVSIFMSLFNVHANWFPVDGKVISVHHQNGNFHKAWLPKASEENEHADVLIETDNGEQILCRQVAGAVARRIVTYAKDGEDCYIDEHMGFIKFGSRVDVYLPLGTEVCVKMGQATTGDQTVIAKLK
ncbi:MAG: phosphatidylserine decarboxylase family protein [Prevotella sp.]|nr:phosphatidylserine decarboxylase family protein [Prevotella sp.]MBQ9652264.1 phosphatidylserine decarboxylase family protein [Prevotella sp.]